jgi:hypothetical protein
MVAGAIAAGVQGDLGQGRGALQRIEHEPDLGAVAAEEGKVDPVRSSSRKPENSVIIGTFGWTCS